MKIKKINSCRVCGNKDIKNILTLGKQPLSGTFLKPNQKPLKAPLDLVFCNGKNNCNLVQLKHSAEKKFLYGKNYGYRSGLNQSMVSHLKDKVKYLKKIVRIKKGDTIVDIGSNDCTTLKFFDRKKLNLVGVDPTGKKFKDYYPKSITLLDTFFSNNILKKRKIKNAKIIMSFAMYYDLEDPVKFAKDIEANLEQNGIWCFEQSYLGTMIDELAYDTICHEHIEYYGLKQIKWILNKSNLKIIDIKFNKVNGGSFSIVAAKQTSKHQQFNKLNYLLNKEIDKGLSSLNYFKKFASRVAEHKKKLISFLKKIKKNKQNICALGASTKGNIVLNYCNLNSKIIDFVGEINNEKLNLVTPGAKIKIIAEKVCLDRNYDFYLILPWHFKKFFLKNKKYKNKKLIFPLPKISVVKV